MKLKLDDKTIAEAEDAAMRDLSFLAGREVGSAKVGNLSFDKDGATYRVKASIEVEIAGVTEARLATLYPAMFGSTE